MIKDITYEYIWTEIIESSIIRIKSAISEETRLKYSFGNQDSVIIKNNIYDLYTKKRDRLKELYHFDDGNPNRRIDIHKIAACFAAVLVENPVFEYRLDVDTELPDDIFLANARLAYSVSLGIVYMGLVSDYIKAEKDEIVQTLIANGKLKTPETTKGHDEYNLGRVKTIALNHVFDNEFDILTYSDMMFWIEYYNRQVLENTLYPMSFGRED